MTSSLNCNDVEAAVAQTVEPAVVTNIIPETMIERKDNLKDGSSGNEVKLTGQVSKGVF